jgi:lipid-A-disaccharide synthase
LDDDNRTVLFSDYHELENKLGGIGASEKTAKLIIEETKK